MLAPVDRIAVSSIGYFSRTSSTTATTSSGYSDQLGRFGCGGFGQCGDTTTHSTVSPCSMCFSRPRSAGGMTATFTAAVQVDDDWPALILGCLLGKPQDVVQARPLGVHEPLTFQLDFATGDASAACQEVIINRRLVSG